MLEPILAVTGREAGYTLDGLQVQHRATQRQTSKTNMHSCSKGQCRVTNYPNMHAFRWWEEAGVPGENTCMHKENMLTLHIKGPSQDLNQEPSCCEATLLTTVQLTHDTVPKISESAMNVDMEIMKFLL